MKKPPYTCPRCGYETRQKGHMRTHLYDKHEICPVLQSNIELDEAMKQYILKNRIYTPSIACTQENSATSTINQVVYNFNVMNNFVGNIDMVTKLHELITYKNVRHVSLDDRIDRLYTPTRLKLEKDVPYHAVTRSDISGIIADVIKTEKSVFNEISVIHDNKVNKLQIFNDGTWNDYYIESSAVVAIFERLKDYYFDAYECYLIRKLENSKVSPMKKTKFKELLQDYYAIIGAFGIPPYVKDTPNNKIMYPSSHDEYWEEGDSWSLSNLYQNVYANAIRKSSITERRTFMKEITKLIKVATKCNVEVVNEMVMDSIHRDTDFKTRMLGLFNSGVGVQVTA